MSEDNNRNQDEWTPWSKYVLIEIQRLSKDQASMNSILQQNTLSLQEHMSQTKAVRDLADAAYQKNELLKAHMVKEKELLDKELKPIKDHVHVVGLIFKWLLPSGFLMALPACIFYILKLFGKI